MVTILGIESTAHTFGIGVVRNGKILANVKDTYTTEKGGIIPMDAAKHHRQLSEKIYLEALEKSKVSESEIDAIAFSQGPGLPPCLIEGMKFAKMLSKKLDKPLVPVNHCIAHLEVGRTTGMKDAVMLYTSGANTQVIAYSSSKYRIFGETLDVGVGNFIDNFARYLGIGFPGGPKIQRLAEQSDKKYIELPYTVKGMDFALSGILTNLKQKVDKMNLDSDSLNSRRNSVNKNLEARNLTKSVPSKSRAKRDKSVEMNYTPENLCYSMQETVFAMLVEVAERALAYTGKSELLLAGGVACNSRLQKMCETMCNERKAKLFVPSRDLLTDNGAMIAYTGEILFRSGIKRNDLEKVDIEPRQRTDGVEVEWKAES